MAVIMEEPPEGGILNTRLRRRLTSVLPSRSTRSRLIDQFHHALYDQIYTEPAETLLPTLPDNTYEMALIMDCIEHLVKLDGAAVVRELQRIIFRSSW